MNYFMRGGVCLGGTRHRKREEEGRRGGTTRPKIGAALREPAPLQRKKPPVAPNVFSWHVYLHSVEERERSGTR